MTREQGRGVPIGETLKDARVRLGMEIAEAEEQTKIRARYIRAMESEEWEVLPGGAYTRAFLRTYAQILGLDGELLADQYRRAYDEPPAMPVGTEPLLERRRSPGSRPPSRGPLIAGLGIAIVVILLLLGILGGEDEGDAGRREAADPGRDAGKDDRAKEQRPEPVEVRVKVTSDSRVCLVGEQGALIEPSLLQAGREERFDGSASYRLDLEAGALEISAGGRREIVETDEPRSFEINAAAIKEISYAGPGCQ